MSPASESASRSAPAVAGDAACDRPTPHGPLLRAVRWIERRLDGLCGEANNPMRQLGAIGFHLFWIVAATGGYLYVFYDTSVEGVWASVRDLSREQPWAGGWLRSLHRYASDALVVVLALHAVREWAYGRLRHFRAFSWVSGVPTIGLTLASGVIGYWLVWDELALFIGVATTEWFGALPGFGTGLIRNFITESAITDRLFSLLMFLHIGVPLALLGALWIHIQRLTRPRTVPSRAVGAWCLVSLLALGLALPAESGPAAQLDRVARSVGIDWFYLAVYPAMYASSPMTVWAVVLGATVLLFALPWIGRRARPQPALVDPANCNGCSRCFADCPYEAIAMAPHPKGRGQIAVVSEQACAACGVCVGACPSSTPFRRGEHLVTGIDLPETPLSALRERLDAALDASRRVGGPAPVVVFACRHGADLPPRDARVVGLSVVCAAQLPPSFVDYALRSGAGSVLISSCPPDDCEFRFGSRWQSDRLQGRREPRLRATETPGAWRVVYAAREDHDRLDAAIAASFASPAATPSAVPARARRLQGPHGPPP